MKRMRPGVDYPPHPIGDYAAAAEAEPTADADDPDRKLLLRLVPLQESVTQAMTGAGLNPFLELSCKCAYLSARLPFIARVISASTALSARQRSHAS